MVTSTKNSFFSSFTRRLEPKNASPLLVHVYVAVVYAKLLSCLHEPQKLSVRCRIWNNEYLFLLRPCDKAFTVYRERI